MNHQVVELRISDPGKKMLHLHESSERLCAADLQRLVVAQGHKVKGFPGFEASLGI